MRRALLAAVLVPLFPVPATLFARTQMPSQADNIRARQDDQLAEARQSEKAAGIAPSPSYARRKREQRQAPFFWLGRDA